MISDLQESVLLSSMGWVDGGSVWSLDTSTGAEKRFRLSDAKYLSLHPGKHGHFSVLHHFEGSQIEITAHRFSAPSQVVAQVTVKCSSFEFTGDSTVWNFLPISYVAYFKQAAWSDFALIRVDSHRPSVQVHGFEWYDDRYDKGYQGIVGVTEIPGNDLLIVSIQRDSRPVLYDPEGHRKVGEIELAGCNGNPRLRFRRTVNELWADDYDTILKINPATWRVERSRRLQGAALGSRQFIGEFNFDSTEAICAVARPFSGDVVGLTPSNLRVRYHCRTGGQPLEVAALRDKRVYARDWKSGNLLQGTLRRRWVF